MIYLGVIVGLILIAAMIYLALNKNSAFHMRIAALAALALMLTTIIICTFIIFTDKTVPVDESVLIVGAVAEETKDTGNSLWIMLFLIVFLAGVFAFIAAHAVRENKKHNEKAIEGGGEISSNFNLNL
jgi:amino acid transporter